MTYNPVVDIRTIHVWSITCSHCGRRSPETQAGIEEAFSRARAEGWICGPGCRTAFCSRACADAGVARGPVGRLKRLSGRALAGAGR